MGPLGISIRLVFLVFFVWTPAAPAFTDSGVLIQGTVEDPDGEAFVDQEIIEDDFRFDYGPTSHRLRRRTGRSLRIGVDRTGPGDPPCAELGSPHVDSALPRRLRRHRPGDGHRLRPASDRGPRERSASDRRLLHDQHERLGSLAGGARAGRGAGHERRHADGLLDVAHSARQRVAASLASDVELEPSERAVVEAQKARVLVPPTYGRRRPPRQRPASPTAAAASE